MYYGNEMSKIETEQVNNKEKDLKNKFDKAFGDLDSLKSELRNNKGKNEKINSSLNNKGNLRESSTHNFFSDEKYFNLLSQIKKSNADDSNTKKGKQNTNLEDFSQSKINSKRDFFGNFKLFKFKFFI